MQPLSLTDRGSHRPADCDTVFRQSALTGACPLSPTLPENLSMLLSPNAYPHPVSEIRLIETHMSWVLLTGDFTYKIKRPVRYPFVDMRTLERRRFLCMEELRLNRRFAPDLYVDVC